MDYPKYLANIDLLLSSTIVVMTNDPSVVGGLLYHVSALVRLL